MSHPAAKKRFQGSTLPKFVEVALPVPIRQTFTYSIPAGYRENIQVGSRMIVPFGARHLTGYAVALHKSLSLELEIEESAIKDVAELLDASPLLTEEIIKLTQWTADYYASSWGEVLKASLPAGINATVEQFVRITNLGRDQIVSLDSAKTIKTQVLASVNETGAVPLRKLEKKFGTTKAQRTVNELIKRGWVEKHQRTISTKVKPKKRKAVKLLKNEEKIDQKRASKAQRKITATLLENENEMLLVDLLERAKVSISPVNTLANRGVVKVFVKEIRRDPLSGHELPKIKDLTLTDAQKRVLTNIETALDQKKYRAFLLHGVTGSGKTEIYIRAMRRALKSGRSAIMLVPEIALTPVFSKRLRAVFGNQVAILHSSLSKGERFDEWRRIRKGDARIVIGTRSAVFAPLQNLGLVVVDEEHDTSYRQHEMPFYHGRDVAIVRAKFSDAVVVLGSATPALESFHNSHLGKYDYLSLPNRIGNRPLAKAEIIDMRSVFTEFGKDPIFAPRLVDAIKETHDRGEQSIILLNRRGFSQFVLCRSCGESIRCKNCEITLTFHKSESKLVCHYCNHREKAPSKCPSCKGRFLYFMGEGTEQIENLLQRKFSGLKIARVDRDTTKKRKELEKTLEMFGKGELDMLVGTQMLAKGHDFHNVTLVGVISVDAGLSLPDFRSAERTFQLLTQVAGRAGRGELPGRVLIQTYYPEHYALRHAKTQSYESFYTEEIEFRKDLNYPPCVALASILIKHPNYNYAFDNARIFRAALDSANVGNRCIVLGPAPAPLARLKGQHRLQILVKSRHRTYLREALDHANAEADAKFCDLKIVYVEIDPVNLL